MAKLEMSKWSDRVLTGQIEITRRKIEAEKGNEEVHRDADGKSERELYLEELLAEAAERGE